MSLEVSNASTSSAILLSVVTLFTTAAWSANKQQERLLEANRVSTIMNTPDKGIRRIFLARSVCIGIISERQETRLHCRADHGAGFVLCRKNEGTGPWTSFRYSISGGSFGFQIGGSATDFVLLL